MKFKNAYLKEIFIYGMLFILFSFSWSIIAPNLFDNYPVYHPSSRALEVGISFLHFSVYNIIFNIFIILYFFTLIYISIFTWTKKEYKLIKKIIFISLLLVIVTSFSQILSPIFGTLDITKYFWTIVVRKFKYVSIGGFLPIPRIQGTFVEPSNLAPFLTGFYSFYLYNSLRKNNFIDIFLTLVIFIFIILSASTTAYISLMIMTFLVVMNLSSIKLSTYNMKLNKKNFFSLSIGIFVVFFSFIIVVYFIIGFQNFLTLINLYFLNKPESGSFKIRIASDLHALEIFAKTFGLGVGLGSNRSSSFLPYLLSQLGIIGTILFGIFITKILIFCYRSLRGTEYFSYFFFIPAALVAQLVAYPDITNPTLWQFIYLSFLVSLIVGDI
ncbi:hypothetical protein [Thermosipho japonicus]|uniref:hypothetical protein n=1 Tax=Thermosipho japonicus TaxID=90323 RepID=UPI00161C96CC|nr:hypothetical protein [Thermosipho japonicus]